MPPTQMQFLLYCVIVLLGLSFLCQVNGRVIDARELTRLASLTAYHPSDLVRVPHEAGGGATGRRGWRSVFLNMNDKSCGGSIITPSWILTAAHCVRAVSTSEITVYAGSNVTTTRTQVLSISTITIHPNYSPDTHVNDVALLHLSTPLNMNDPGVGVIDLPSASSTAPLADGWPSPGAKVVAVAWSPLNESGPSSSILQRVLMHTIDHTSPDCFRMRNLTVQFCAVARSTDTCQGHSGGPVITKTSSGQWVLAGVTSVGYGCALSAQARIYTRIVPYLTWINSTIFGVVGDKNIQTTNSPQNTDQTTEPISTRTPSSLSPRVKSMSWGSVEVEGQDQPFKDVKLYPGGAIEWDWRETKTRHQPGIQPGDLDKLLENSCDIIILSRGMEKRLHVTDETRQLLESRGMKLGKTYFILPSNEAMKLYNKYVKEKKRVGALIHSTC